MNKPNPTTIYFHSIDALRGFAALAVCLFHFTDGFLRPDNLLRVINQYGYLGVDAFFVISGFVVPYSFAQKNYSITQFWSFFKKRFIRIEPAYWVSIALIMFKDTLAHLTEDYRYFHFPEEWTFKQIALHFVHGNDIFNEKWLINPYWTLAIDWQFYIFIGLIFPLVKRAEFWVRYPLYALFIATKWWFGENTKPYLVYHAMLFLPGIILFHYKKRFMSRWEAYALLLAGFYFIQMKLGWNHCIAVALSCLIIEFLTKKWDTTAFFGKISYSMYLTHIFCGWWFIVVALHILQDEWFKTIVVLLGVGLSIVFAKIFYDKVEMPTQQWAKKI